MVKVDGIWMCATCTQKFRDKTDLRRHVESRHLNKNITYRCNLCQYTTRTSYYFRKHELMHEKQDALAATAILEQSIIE